MKAIIFYDIEMPEIDIDITHIQSPWDYDKENDKENEKKAA